MAYTIVNLDRVPYPNPVSVKCSEAKGLENGAFVELGVIGVDGQREVYAMEKLTGEVGKQLALHASSVLMYDEKLDERDFILESGKIGRFYLPAKGDMVTIAQKFVEAGAVAGDVLEAKANSYELQKLTAGIPVAKIVEVAPFEGQPSYTIEFL